MGNPTAQPRTNGSKSSLKPKHRLSGSVSNISFTSEDLKPKHRHSGSASNISLTPEDLQPKHRQNGSVSNISITPEDLLPKHRHSGSVSNITINSKDLSSPSRGDFISPSSVSSVSSASTSLKEKRLKRRTRSSLGGTEDFIKELDFLTPSSNGRHPDTSTRKELLKLSLSTPVSEPATLQESSETLAPVPESSLPAHVEGSSENIPVEDANHSTLAKANVSENGGSRHDEALIRSTEESVQPCAAVQLADPKCNGIHRGSSGPVEISNEHQLVSNEVLEHCGLENSSSLCNGHLPVTAATLAEESGSTEVSDVQNKAQEVLESDVDPAKSLPFNKGGPSVSQHSSETQEFTNSLSRETTVNVGIVMSPENGDPSEELPQDDPGNKDLQEEKVSVQKRIEELEKITRGRPVHFRSQSLSLPRPFDISHAKLHEAEGSKGFKMPAYRAPLDVSSVSEVSSLESAGMSPEQELRKESLHCKGTASTEDTASTTPAVHDVRALDTDPQNTSRNQEGRSESQTSRSSSDDNSGQPKPQSYVVHVLSDDLKAIEVFTDKMTNGIHRENGTTAETFKSVPANKTETRTESTVQSETPEDFKAQPNSEKGKVVDIGKEDNVESGLGEPYVMVSADSVPREFSVIPTVTDTEPPTDHTRETGGAVETAVGGDLVEPLPGRLKSGTIVSAERIGMIPAAAQTGIMPVVHQRSVLPEAPYVQASIVEQGSQDYETSMLLTKQPAVDPLFIDSQLDRLWEMHSQELSIEESSGNELRESSAQDDDPRPYANGILSHAEVTPASSAPNGNAQSDKSGKHDRPRTPLRSLLAEEDAEECADSGPIGTPPQNQSASPRGSLFKRIVSGGKNSPTKLTTPTQFSPKTQTAAKPFLSSCICCFVK